MKGSMSLRDYCLFGFLLSFSFVMVCFLWGVGIVDPSHCVGESGRRDNSSLKTPVGPDPGEARQGRNPAGLIWFDYWV